MEKKLNTMSAIHLRTVSDFTIQFRTTLMRQVQKIAATWRVMGVTQFMVGGISCCLLGALCGFLLAHFQHQIIARRDECASSPCQNGGRCVDGFNSYMCQCPAGYMGIHCQTDLDECVSAPCRNGGTCKDGVNSYRCTCPSGYTGRQCQMDYNECESGPCRNGGHCHDRVNAYVCSCSDGFTGVNCESVTYRCPCRNGGYCNYHGRCICIDGYTGIYCQVEPSGYVGYVVGGIVSILGSVWYFGVLL